jgi:hypothetical protein
LNFFDFSSNDTKIRVPTAISMWQPQSTEHHIDFLKTPQADVARADIKLARRRLRRQDDAGMRIRTSAFMKKALAYAFLSAVRIHRRD